MFPFVGAPTTTSFLEDIRRTLASELSAAGWTAAIENVGEVVEAWERAHGGGLKMLGLLDANVHRFALEVAGMTVLSGTR
jgi:hypothetical protein